MTARSATSEMRRGDIGTTAIFRSLALNDDELGALEVAATQLQVAGFRTSQGRRRGGSP